MAVSIETAVAQFHITSGLVQESAPCLRAVEPRSLFALGARRDRVYILLETVGSFPDPDTVCRRTADIVQDM